MTKETVKQPRSKFYNKASLLLSRGAPHEVLYDLVDEFEITQEEIKTYLDRRPKSKAVSDAVVAGKEEKKLLYTTLDVKFIEEYKNIVIFQQGDNADFYEYKDGVYSRVGKTDMYNKMDSFFVMYSLFEIRESKKKVEDTITRVRALLSRTEGRYFTREILEQQKYYLNLKNGLLDINTLELIPHTPKYFSTTQVPYEYDPKAEAPEFLSFIQTVSNQTESTGEMIQEMFGYCLGNGNPKHKVFYLYGDTARNGKSTAAKILCGLVGWGNVSTLSLQQISGETSSMLTAIVDKKINFSDEISSKFVQSSRLTAMSAEGVVQINPKYEPTYFHKIQTNFIITCNDLPLFHDAQGMKHRMISIPFRYQIPPKERKDRYDEVLLEKEGSGILNWALRGMQRLKENKNFTTNKESEEDMLENTYQSDPTYAFLELLYDFSPEYTEAYSSRDLYGEEEQRERDTTIPATGFCRFYREHGIRKVSLFSFQKELSRFSSETKKITRKKIQGYWHYSGLRLKEETVSEDDIKNIPF